MEEQHETQNSNIFSVIQLQDKRIEPDKDKSRDLNNRNMTLGNTDKKEFYSYKAETRIAQYQQNVPLTRGGWFCQGFANMTLKQIEYEHTMSRSVDGFNQKIMVSSNNTQVIDDKRETGFFASIIGRKKQTH